jgi:hypothetical protein
VADRSPLRRVSAELLERLSTEETRAPELPSTHLVGGMVKAGTKLEAFWSVDVHQQPPSTWWGACIQEIHSWGPGLAREAMAGRGGSRHAFAMFGGQGKRPSEVGRTFFEEFPRASSLHRPA